MDHPRDHINDAVLPAVPLEEPEREAVDALVLLGIPAPSVPQDTPAFQGPSHSQHEDYLPQLTDEQKEDLMRIHTELTSQENPATQVHSTEFEEPRDRTDDSNAILKEPQDVSKAILGEPQGKSDDSKSISEEESDQEEWTPRAERKQGKPKSSGVKRKYAKRKSAKTEDGEGSSGVKRKYDTRSSAKKQDGEGSGK